VISGVTEPLGRVARAAAGGERRIARISRRPSLKVAIGSPDDPRSSVWRLSVHGDEVYFGTRDGMGYFKVSLHKTGDWRIAFKRPLDPKGKNTDRVILKWQRPDEYQPRSTACFTVIVSPILPRRPFKSRQVTNPQVKWLPMPAPNRVLILLVAIIRAGIVVDPILFVDDKLIGHLKKANGESVCVIAHERLLTEPMVSKIHEIMRGVKINATSKISEDSFTSGSRALMFVSDDHIGPSNPPSVYDVPLGWDNVVMNLEKVP
jgi:hypothetical protein